MNDITIVIILTIILAFLTSWYVKEGNRKWACVTILIGNVLYIYNNVRLASQDWHAQWGMLLYIILNVWSISMAVWGLRKERKDKSSSVPEIIAITEEEFL